MSKERAERGRYPIIMGGHGRISYKYGRISLFKPFSSKGCGTYLTHRKLLTQN